VYSLCTVVEVIGQSDMYFSTWTVCAWFACSLERHALPRESRTSRQREAVVDLRRYGSINLKLVC